MFQQQRKTRQKTAGLALLCFFVFTFGGHAAPSDLLTHTPSALESNETGTRDSEYRIKALFLYRLVRWVTWPTSNLSKDSKKITIGVVGKDPFGKELDLLTKLKPVKKRKIVIKRFKKVSDIQKTQVLFVSRSLKDAEVNEVIAIANRDHVLVVGEKPKFVDKGGAMSLLIKKNKLRFEANTMAAKKAKLKISSQILKMASRIVKENK